MFQARTVPTPASLAIVVAVVALVATTPARAGHDAELDDLQMVLAALDAVSYDHQLELLAAGLGEVARTHGWEGSCGDALWIYARAPYDSRTAQVAVALDDCPATCPSGTLRGEVMLRAAAMPEALRTGIIAAACDVEGPDPVFGGDLAPLRTQMPLVEYWAFRAGFAQLAQRLDEIGGDRAEAIGGDYDELARDVAARLSLHLPPPELLQRLPATTALRPARASTAVVVTRESVAVNGETVVTLAEGAVPAEQLDGRGIAALVDALGEPGESLLLQIDRDATSDLLLQVLTSGGLAGATRFELAGLNVDPARQVVTQVSIPRLADFLGTVGEDPDEVPLSLAVVIDGEGFGVVGNAFALHPNIGVAIADEDGDASIRVPRGEDGFDHAALGTMLARVKDEFPHEDQVTVVLDGDVPYHVVMATLDTCRDQPAGGAGDLFPLAVITPGLGEGLDPGLLRDDLGALESSDLGGLGGLGTRGRTGESGAAGGYFGRNATGADAQGGSPIILGALDKSAISDEVRRHLAQIRYCYQRELTKQPALSGKAVVKFVIGADGMVSSAEIKETTMADPDVESCLCDVIRRMEFPEPRGGGIVIVSYPFIFKPAE